MLVVVVGSAFIVLQHHQGTIIARINGELGKTNQFLAGVANKLGAVGYLSPQHYRSIFSGEKDVVVATERKKLTIFFSDVVGFTSSSERLQPEELTGLLNEYLTAMSQVAIRHGGSVNKFIGDAMLVFFRRIRRRGGAVEDARACLRMAFEMQQRLAELNVKWRKQGIEEPFRARMGINTGYCNVGNFGSDQRMDYTIIGAEANLAARLQSIAKVGGIILSYETFMLVSDMVRAHALEPITLKGIGRPIIPYEVEGVAAEREGGEGIIAEHTPGLDLLLDMRAVDPASTERVTHALEAALAAVRKSKPDEAAPAGPARAPTAVILDPASARYAERGTLPFASALPRRYPALLQLANQVTPVSSAAISTGTAPNRERANSPRRSSAVRWMAFQSSTCAISPRSGLVAARLVMMKTPPGTLDGRMRSRSGRSSGRRRDTRRAPAHRSRSAGGSAADAFAGRGHDVALDQRAEAFAEAGAGLDAARRRLQGLVVDLDAGRADRLRLRCCAE